MINNLEIEIDPNVEEFSSFNLRTQLEKNEEAALPAEQTEIEEKIKLSLEMLESDEKEDFIIARKNLIDIAKSGTDALEILIRMAKYSDSPRMFEVVATLINSVAATNMNLIQLHEKKLGLISKKGYKKEDQTPKPPMTVNADKAVFVGTTAELNKLFRREQDDRSTQE